MNHKWDDTMKKRNSSGSSGEEQPVSPEQTSRDPVELTEAEMDDIARKTFDVYWEAREQKTEQIDVENLKKIASHYRQMASKLDKEDCQK